ncbi:nucleotide sugar dehydrogenase [Halorubrum coriense DSM 10284]|uniref:UDP-N-acetyl-D-mannosamine dehydrogenase n=1 Tax=Halorubrum coriense DSM 10284 TaxID=1227466 RepID=M0EEV8_9EURY|nr:nucleotide sugar dehydrogenase [Halorubrum coriense]ELZ46326.1 nucleotide sugar dehydrogenase [Halorubrum coriense DSM 10284]
MTRNASATETIGLYGTDASPDEQRAAFREGRVPVAVYGMGKIGLPLSLVYAETTGAVTGVDVDPDRVAALTDGTNPLDHEPGVSSLLPELVADDRFAATTDGEAAAAAARVHVIVVPTVIDGDSDPDLSALEAAVETVRSGLDPGDTVFVESTVPPGTCADVVEPILTAGDREPGEFGLAHAPERTASGRALRDIRGSYPKVVGGVDAESGRVAALVYGELTDNEVVRTSDARTAECVKLFEGVYRDVNIALANELATLTGAFGVDVIETIEAANTQPYCDILTPGAGVGGHCIPYYPYFLLDGVTDPAPLIRTARSVNERMPGFVVETLVDGLAADRPIEGATVALFGVAYRAGVPETRASPAVDIARRLDRLGATVLAVDPVLDELPAMPAERVAIDEIPDRDVDAAVLVTAHDEFRRVDWSALEREGADGSRRGVPVVDGRQALDLSETAHDVYTVGRGWD